MKIKPGDYNIKEESGSIILTPLAPKIEVPRLAKAPKFTPIEGRDRYDDKWFSGCNLVGYDNKSEYPWKTEFSMWKQARLVTGYRYAWDPEWELFMDDDLEVDVWLRDGTTSKNNKSYTDPKSVDSWRWVINGCRTIVGFEVIEK